MLVIGAGGHALEVLDVLEKDNYPHQIFFYDDVNPEITTFRKYAVLKSAEEVKSVLGERFHFILGIGNPQARRTLFDRFTALGGQLSAVISSKSIISNSLSHRNFDVMNLCYLGPEAEIGKGTLINTGAQIHHEVKIGEFCEISPRVLLLGKVQIGNGCSIGGNATILPKVKIGHNVIIGAGSVVTKDVPDNQLIMGVPGKIIKEIA